jgi:anthranilate phosphoribosyltransferase
MNAGAALALAARSEVVDDDSLAAAVREGIRRAAEVIDSGLAAAALDRWIAISAARTPA